MGNPTPSLAANTRALGGKGVKGRVGEEWKGSKGGKEGTKGGGGEGSGELVIPLHLRDADGRKYWQTKNERKNAPKLSKSTACF